VPTPTAWFQPLSLAILGPTRYAVPMRIVITGANRGIGLELVKQCLGRGDSVIATARNPHDARELQSLASSSRELRVLACDVGDDASVRAFAAKVTGAVDALINNAGVMGAMTSLADLDTADALKTYSINALGPLRVTGALLPHLRQGKVKKVLHVTSGMGSIGDNDSGGAYGYRMSKAALNMGSKSMATDLRSEGFSVAVINPGWVKTDMGGSGAPIDVATSAAGILAQLDSLSPKNSGEFLDYAGKQWPW
jgi:NAD(P)-dependent dehydrogenase (short-subunit alcohol dehydrogenase family)